VSNGNPHSRAAIAHCSLRIAHSLKIPFLQFSKYDKMPMSRGFRDVV
jgi:hypothetical protein